MCDVETEKKSLWVDFLMAAVSTLLFWDTVKILMRPRKGVGRG